jgi:hypothetical protein
VAALRSGGETTLTLPAFEGKCLIALRSHAHPRALFPTPLLVKALRIVGPLGPIHSPFNVPQFFPPLDDTPAELREDGIALPSSRNSAGADIRADHTGLRLAAVRRPAFLHELDLTSANGDGCDGE